MVRDSAERLAIPPSAVDRRHRARNGGYLERVPTIGESHSVPIGARKFGHGLGSTSCIVPSVASYDPSGSCRVMNIDRTDEHAVFDEPLLRLLPQHRYSNGGVRSRLRPLFTPAV